MVGQLVDTTLVCQGEATQSADGLSNCCYTWASNVPGKAHASYTGGWVSTRSNHAVAVDLTLFWQENGKRNGFGMLKLSNGDMYEGMWSNDERCGFGIMKYSSGEEYKGTWEHNRLHGSASSLKIIFMMRSCILNVSSTCFRFALFSRQRNFETRQWRHFFGRIPRRCCARQVWHAFFTQPLSSFNFLQNNIKHNR